MVRQSLFLLLFLLLSSLIAGAGAAAGSQAKPAPGPSGAVLLVLDGLGSSYVYPEQQAYALDGSALRGAVIFNLTGGLTGGGARVLDLRVPVPETTQSHSILITGSAGTDPDRLGPTIMDAAREKGYLCLGLLERGDAMPVLQEMDAVLYLKDNSIRAAQPTVGLRAGAPANISLPLQKWRDRFARYTGDQGVLGYSGYNAWALDAASDLVRQLSGRRFLMLVNAGAVDSAGHYMGPEGYLDVAASLDGPLGRLEEACRQNDVLLVVTADHGMVFPSDKGKGGHAGGKYATRLEALRVPLVFLGPGVEELNLGGRWSQVDIAPTLLHLLNISPGPSMKGEIMPVAGRYAVPAGGAREEELREETGLAGEWKTIVGIILILAINLAGIAVIVRVWRRG